MTKMTLGTHPYLLGFDQLERLAERAAKGADAYPPYREAPFHASDPEARRTVLAKFESTCPECREPIWIDDPITIGQDGFYVHGGCA